MNKLFGGLGIVVLFILLMALKSSCFDTEPAAPSPSEVSLSSEDTLELRSELAEKIRAKEKALMWQRIYVAGQTKGTRRHSIAFNVLKAMERQLRAMGHELKELQKK
ncbi:MAG: hypothetical protein HY005_02730 [Candidatus Staskawiczbacteria bacterium]|nr:hypothetical protein [Candidatus Staskawiczbacteria bacterium]MBI3337513.1 hypothetical protein [Candidatus Staskawiczbacteria bacterium]